MPKEITIITGATASGKSQCAIDFALENNASIISCDSIQVYKYMDIGSAKLTKDEMQGVKHYLIDIAKPSKSFDVFSYIEEVKLAIEDITASGKNIVVAGGSPFYLQSFFSAITDDIKVSETTRNYVKNLEEDGGKIALQEKLLSLDSNASKFVDMANPRRLTRAIERVMESGLGVEEILENFKKMPCPYGDIKRNVIFLNRPKDEMQERIEKRTQLMLNAGLIKECENLLKLDIKTNPSAYLSTGYIECFRAIESGNIDEAKLAQEISQNTLKLVKKQGKFFRNTLKLNA